MGRPAPERPRRFRGRLLALLVVGLVGGQPGFPAPPAPPKPATAKARPDLARLKALVVSGEQAAQEKDWDAAGTRADEAEVLVADWPADFLAQPEAAALLTRLQELESHLPDSEHAPETPDPGLKETAEVVPLSAEALRAELAQVQSAESGAVFDFPIDLNDKVLAWVHEFSTAKRGFMERTLSRATQWLPMVRQIFAEERIPQDLAYLAVIESGFLNGARSYAKAVGMWQFIRSTGRIYGLNGNAWVEERRDPVKAARASARYLRRLYETSGDWYLALAGYNAGPMTTERAIQNLGSRNFWDMARSRWLRNQTKNYVPELCAAILIGHYPERYGFKVEQLQPYAYETVEVDRMTSLAVLARFANSDVDVLKDLNPELLRASTPPGHYNLRVPPGMSGATARALARIPAGQRLDFKAYKIRKGESLARVAARFNLSPEDLLAANDISKAQFKAGRVIKVPPPPPAPIDDRDLLNPVQREKLIEDRPLEPLPGIPGTPGENRTAAVGPAPSPLAPGTTAPVPEPPPPAAPDMAAPAPVVEPPAPPARVKAAAPVPEVRPRTHTVKSGETLFAISVRYGLDLNGLRKWNRIKGNKIQPGQKLRLGP